MKILFLDCYNICSYEDSGIFTDLAREFIKLGNSVYTVSIAENAKKTYEISSLGNVILKVKTGSVLKNKNLLAKGINIILLNYRFKNAIKKYCKGMHFDLVLYSTPPITLYGVIKHLKKINNAKTYLLLKDIFPQNAIDLGIMSKTGLKGIVYRYFRDIEKKYYTISDAIGCMSQANVDYLLKNNPEINPIKVHVNPNSADLSPFVNKTAEQNEKDKQRYNIPFNCKVFLYGGNLGRPQGIPFVVNCLKDNMNKPDRFFLICGTGSDYELLESFFVTNKPNNMRLINGLSRKDFDELVSICDVGLIFLDNRFTIPNYPSRLLSYMQAEKPVLACTDKNTDIGLTITEGKFGWWCESTSVRDFTIIIDNIVTDENLKKLGNNAKAYLFEHFGIENSAKIILDIINAGL